MKYELKEERQGMPGVFELAARLGVKPAQPEDGSHGALIVGDDGQPYPLFSIINALLDRLDRAERAAATAGHLGERD